MSKVNDASNRTLSLTKVFNAPPKGMSIDVIEHSFKVGGRWKYSMPMPDNQLFISEGQYREIEQ